MRAGPYLFQPGGWLTAATFAVIMLFVQLGIWQLHRADQKERLKAEIDGRAALPPVELHADTTYRPDLRFRRATVRGRFDPAGRQIFLDNQTHDGRAGVHVLAPVRLQDSEVRVLIDRGWIALSSGRDHLPEAGVPEGDVEVHGIIDVPALPPFILNDAARPGPSWGRLWPYLDLDYFSRYAGVQVKPFLIRQDPGDPHGYARVLPTVETRRAMHIGYAIQWFGFAAAAFGVYLGMSVSRADRLHSA